MSDALPAASAEPGSPDDESTQASLRSYIRMERNIPCPRCGYDMAGLPGLRCPECGRVYTLTDVGTRPRPAWMKFAMGGWGALLLAGISIGIVAVLGEVTPPQSETLRMLFYGRSTVAGGVGGATALMLVFQAAALGQRIRRRPWDRARAGGTLLIAWVLMVVEVVGAAVSRLV